MFTSSPCTVEQSLARADRAGDDILGVDAAARAHAHAAAEIALAGRLLDLERAAHRARGVLGIGAGRVEGDQHRVALELGDRAAVTLDRDRNRLEVGVQRRDQALGRDFLGDRREALDVSEEHARLAHLAVARLQRLLRRRAAVGDLGRNEASSAAPPVRAPGQRSHVPHPSEPPRTHRSSRAGGPCECPPPDRRPMHTARRQLPGLVPCRSARPTCPAPAA